jgi:hypothetical protein
VLQVEAARTPRTDRRDREAAHNSMNMIDLLPKFKPLATPPAIFFPHGFFYFYHYLY